jgi:VWFA-related protein
MRTAYVCSAAVALTAALAAASPQSPGAAAGGSSQSDAATPAFRAGIDVLTVDVVALDGDGRPVTDLGPSDFTVRIDGQARRVISADLIRLETGGSAEVSAPAPAPAATPSAVAAARGRRIVIAIDQLQIRPGTIAPLLAAASRFVDRLTARDQVSVITFPEPGPRVEFTTDKARVHQALQAPVGTPPVARSMAYSLGVYDAVAIHERERTMVSEGTSTADPPTVADAMRRACTAGSDDGLGLDACRMQILSEASTVAQSARADAAISVRAIRSIVDQMAALDGPKTLLLVSAGLLINDPSDIDALTRAADASRTSIHVLAVDAERADGVATDALPGNQGSSTGEDRRLRLEGLAAISAPGALYRIDGSGDGVFARIASELSAYYLLAVESRAGDEQRTAQKVDVRVQRRGSTTRSSLAFARAPAPTVRASTDDRLREALASGAAITELPVGLATFARRDPQSGKVHVDLAAQVRQSGAARDLGAGYLVLGESSAVVASSTAPQKPASRDGSDAIEFTASLLLDPGTYSLRFSVVDPDGRRGTVVRDLAVPRLGGAEVTASDLLVSDGPPTAQTLRPSVDTRIGSGGLGAYLELYSSTREDLEWTSVEFEIAESDEGPPVLAESAALDDGAESSWRVASAVLDVTSLPPGRYVVRARAELDGEVVAARVRPIVIGAAGSGAAPDGR